MQSVESLISDIKESYRKSPILSSVLTIILFLIFVTGALVLFSSDDNFRGYEQNVIYSIQHLVGNGTLYTNPEEIPYSITQYTPVYHMISAAFAKVLNLTAGEDIKVFYIVARAVSISSLVLATYVLTQITRELVGKRSQISYIVPFMFLIAAMPWGFLIRPDITQVLFEFTAIYFAIRSFKIDSNRNLFLTGVFLGLSLMTKQSGLFILLAVLLSYITLTLSVKNTLYISTGFGAAVFAVMVFVVRDTTLPIFYSNVMLGVTNGIDINWAIKFIVKPGMQLFWPIIILLGYTIYQSDLNFSKLKKGLSNQQLFIVLTTVLYTMAYTLSMIKKGSAENYLITIVSYTTILIVIVDSHIQNEDSSTGRQLLKAIALLAIFIPFVSLTQQYLPEAVNSYTVTESYEEEISVFMSETIQDGEYIFTNHRPLINRLPLNTVFPHQDITSCCAFKYQVYDYSRFQKDLQKGEVKYLVFKNGERLNNYVETPFINFEYYAEVHGFTVYKLSEK